MKGKVVTFKDRVEMINLLNQLRIKDTYLTHAIHSLVTYLKKDYWGVHARQEIFDILLAQGKHLDKFPRLRGKKK